MLQEGVEERNLKLEGCVADFDAKFREAVVDLVAVPDSDGFEKLRAERPLTLGLVRAIIEHYKLDKKLTDDTKFDDLAEILDQEHEFDGTEKVALRQATEFAMEHKDALELEKKAANYAIEIVKKGAESAKKQEISDLTKKLKDAEEAKNGSVEKIMTLDEIQKRYPDYPLVKPRNFLSLISLLTKNFDALEKEHNELKAKLAQSQGQPAVKIEEDSDLTTVVIPVAQNAIENLQQVTKNKNFAQLGLGKEVGAFSEYLNKINEELDKIEKEQKPGNKHDDNANAKKPDPTRKVNVDYGIIHNGTSYDYLPCKSKEEFRKAFPKGYLTVDQNEELEKNTNYKELYLKIHQDEKTYANQ